MSIFSPISTSLLAFIAIFAYFLNSQKFTLQTINSIVVLTISPVLLIVRPDFVSSSSSNMTNQVSGKKYAVELVCTLLASARCTLLLNIALLYFRKVRDRTPIMTIFEFVIYESAIAMGIVLMGSRSRFKRK